MPPLPALLYAIAIISAVAGLPIAGLALACGAFLLHAGGNWPG